MEQIYSNIRQKLTSKLYQFKTVQNNTSIDEYAQVLKDELTLLLIYVVKYFIQPQGSFIFHSFSRSLQQGGSICTVVDYQKVDWFS